MALGWRTPRQTAGDRQDRARLRRALVNLEDLWGETAPQNVPDAGPIRSNWRRKARFELGSFRNRTEVVDILRAVADAHAKGRST